jgi:hypothetical protein
MIEDECVRQCPACVPQHMELSPTVSLPGAPEKEYVSDGEAEKEYESDGEAPEEQEKKEDSCVPHPMELSPTASKISRY